MNDMQDDNYKTSSNEEVPDPLCAYMFSVMTNEEIDIKQSDIDVSLHNDRGTDALKAIEESQFFNPWDTGECVGGPATAIARDLCRALLVCVDEVKLALPVEVERNLIGGFTLLWGKHFYCVIRPFGTVDIKSDYGNEFHLPFHIALPLIVERLGRFLTLQKEKKQRH